MTNGFNRIAEKGEAVVFRVLQIISGVLMGMLVAIVLYSVFCRYVLNASLAWAEELSRYRMIDTVCCAADPHGIGLHGPPCVCNFVIYHYIGAHHSKISLSTRRKGGPSMVVLVFLVSLFGFILLNVPIAFGLLLSGITPHALRRRFLCVYYCAEA